MQLPVTIKLNKPIQHGSKLIEEIVFEREMIGSDMFGVRFSGRGIDAKEYAMMAARLTGLPDPVINGLNVVDFRAVMETVESFLSDGPPTGTAA